jgi:hypothetical protein
MNDREQLLHELMSNPSGVCFSIVAGANWNRFQAAKSLAERGECFMDQQQGGTVFVWTCPAEESGK